MSYTVEELNPKKPVLVLDNEEFNISLITLHHESHIKEAYGSLADMYDAMRAKPELLIDIIWMLLIEKEKFKSLEVFKTACLSSKESIVEWSKRMSACLDESVSKSMPLVKNKKLSEDINKIIGSTTDQQPCYAVYFDSVAKRYGGYTLDTFYEFTLRQLHIILKTINDESYKELETQAALQGRKLKPRITFQDITEEEEQEQTDQAVDALKRLQKEYESKKEE